MGIFSDESTEADMAGSLETDLMRGPSAQVSQLQ